MLSKVLVGFLIAAALFMAVRAPAVAQECNPPVPLCSADPTVPVVTPTPRPTRTPAVTDEPSETDEPRATATPAGPKPPPSGVKGPTPSPPPRFDIPDATLVPGSTPVVSTETSTAPRGTALAGLIVSGVMIAAAGLIWRRYLA